MAVTDQGFDAGRLERVGNRISAEIDSGLYDGASLHVARGGQVVIEGVYGFADRDGGRKLDPGDTFFTMSLGKQFLAPLVLNRVERGDLSLRMRVGEIIPEFAVRGKEPITLEQLLTHRSGVLRLLPMIAPEVLGNLETFVKAVCASIVEAKPGERVAYSVVAGHAVMAEMVRRVDAQKRSFREILQQDIFDAVGMKDTSLGLRPDLAERMCPVKPLFTEKSILDRELLTALPAMVGEEGEVPAGGYVSTAADIHLFAEMLRRGGEINGHRILSPAMIDLATRNHTGTVRNEVFDCVLELRGWEPWPAYLGLGFWLRGDTITPGPFGSLNSPRSYGGFGAGSTGFWVDPERDLTFVMLTTGLMEESRSFERFQRISDLVVSALVE
jgi:CubicO group peptidase (beta-lactamase class C family)